MEHRYGRGTLLPLGLAIAALWVSESGAQPVGSFRWQLSPFCNVLSLQVTRSGPVYTLDGYDDQCGGAPRASVVGTAHLNADGSIGIGLTTVLAPGGAPVHLDVRIELATLNGVWHDSGGSSGDFVFTPGPGTGGVMRPPPSNDLPAGSITAAEIAEAAVGAAQIAAGAVGSSHIALGAVSGSHIASGSVTAAHLADGSVGAAQIAAGAVGSVHLGAATVGGLHIGAGAVGGPHINPSQVQARVTGTCGSGEYMRGIHADGNVLCEALPPPSSPSADQAGTLIRKVFGSIAVPPQGQAAVELASISFVAPISGTALLKGRGYCNMTPLAASVNGINVSAGVSAATAFASGIVAQWGVVRVPVGSPSGIHQHGWTAETPLPGLVAGTTYVVGLYARHELGNTTSDCSGTFVVELFSAVAP